LVRQAALATALTLAAGDAAACRLALILAIDVSSSVDAEEDRLQRGGLAAALIAPEVMQAFLVSPRPVALAAFEWSGRYNQQDLLDWTLIETEEDLFAASEAIAGSRRSHDDFPTAMGYALGYAATRLRDAPVCDRQTVDVAGDGVNNDGFGPADAYNAFPFDGVTVNGLLVDGTAVDEDIDLVAYYLNEVMQGPDAFVEVANGFAEYQTTMRRKLQRELGVMMLGEIQ
jgi:hypothetical protein